MFDFIFYVRSHFFQPLSRHPILVVSTESGSLFGLSSRDGSITWALRHACPSSAPPPHPLSLLRSAAGHAPIAAVVCQGIEEAAIQAFDPITGEVTLPIERIGGQVVHVAKLPVEGGGVHPLAVADARGIVSVWPKESYGHVAGREEEVRGAIVNATAGVVAGFVVRWVRKGMENA